MNEFLFACNSGQELESTWEIVVPRSPQVIKAVQYLQIVEQEES